VYCAQEKADDETSAKEEPTLRIKGVNVKKILDPTGCGNTFCGGFLAGWYNSHELSKAALWGSISASFSQTLYFPNAYIHVSTMSQHFP
jgi:sugar/nucleoside kinase (ribokinase family)